MARRRAAGPRVRAGRPGRDRAAHREAADAGPPRHAGRARGQRARAGGARALVPVLARGQARCATSSSTDDESKRIRGFRFLTEKPVLLLLNIGEGDIARAVTLVAGFAARYEHRHARSRRCQGEIEMEIGQLEPDEAAVFRADLGLTESSLDRVIRLSYRLLGLISFFTAGPDETRAWTIPDGLNRGRAAGAIHSDLARGFIRAEVVAYEDLVELGSMAEARKHGQAALGGQDLQSARRRRHRGAVQRLSPPARVSCGRARHPARRRRAACGIRRPLRPRMRQAQRHRRARSRLHWPTPAPPPAAGCRRCG